MNQYPPQRHILHVKASFFIDASYVVVDTYSTTLKSFIQMDPKYRIQEWPIHTFDLEFLQSLIIKGQRFLQQPGSSNDNHTNVYCTHTHTQQIVYQQIITSIHAFAVQLEIIKLSNCWSLIIVERVRNEWWSWCNRFRYTNFPRPREQKKKSNNKNFNSSQIGPTFKCTAKMYAHFIIIVLYKCVDGTKINSK